MADEITDAEIAVVLTTHVRDERGFGKVCRACDMPIHWPCLPYHLALTAQRARIDAANAWKIHEGDMEALATAQAERAAVRRRALEAAAKIAWEFARGLRIRSGKSMQDGDDIAEAITALMETPDA